MTELQSSDQIADWVYGASAYPIAYRKLVADSRAKKDQYRRIATYLPIPAQGQSITILEPGPSNVPLLKNAIQELRLPISRFRLIGLDKYPRMHPDVLEMLTASVTDIPLPDGSVDVVVMSSVLFFVSDQQLALDECARVLKPGGKFILSEPDIAKTASLTQGVLAYELQAIRAETSKQWSGWIGDWIYRYRVAKTIAPRLPYLMSARSINKRILAQQTGREGFTESHLLQLLAAAGLTITMKARVYADAYFLLVCQK